MKTKNGIAAVLPYRQSSEPAVNSALESLWSSEPYS